MVISKTNSWHFLSYNEYTTINGKGKWANDNCSDPEKLFKSIIYYKPEKLIEYVSFLAFDQGSQNVH